MSRKFTWYRDRFTVTWQDGSTDTVVSHHSEPRRKLYQYGSEVFVKRISNIEGYEVKYVRPWIRKTKVKVRYDQMTERVLNFEQMKSIDHEESEEVVEVVKP